MTKYEGDFSDEYQRGVFIEAIKYSTKKSAIINEVNEAKALKIYDKNILACLTRAIEPESDLLQQVEKFAEDYSVVIGSTLIGFLVGFGAGCGYVTLMGRLTGTELSKVFAIDIPRANIHIKGHDVNLAIIMGAGFYAAKWGYDYATNSIAEIDLATLKQDVLGCVVDPVYDANNIAS